MFRHRAIQKWGSLLLLLLLTLSVLPGRALLDAWAEHDATCTTSCAEPGLSAACYNCSFDELTPGPAPLPGLPAFTPVPGIALHTFPVPGVPSPTPHRASALSLRGPPERL